MSSETLKKALLQTHPEYAANITSWELFRDAYEGGGGFKDGSHIDRYGNEGEDKYKRRQALAYYINYCQPIIDTNLGYLFKQKVVRTTTDADVIEFHKKATLSGELDIDAFMERVSQEAQIYGHVWIAVDVPTDTVETKAQEIEAGIRPYAYTIPPTNVLDWKADERGDIEWVKAKEYYTENGDTPLSSHTPAHQYRVWDREQWVVYRKDSNGEYYQHEEGTHGLGVVPMFIAYNRIKDLPSMMGISEINDIAPTNKRHYNVRSEIDENVRSNTFPLLIYPGVVEDSNVNLGADKTLEFSGETGHVPAFIAPPSSVLDSLHADEGMLENQMLEMAKQNYAIGVASSGVSLAFRFLKTNQALVKKATWLRLAELQLARMVCRWKGKNPDDLDLSVEYPTDFGVEDLAQDIQDAFDAISLDIGETFNEEYKKKMARRLLPAADPETLKQIDGEIEKFKHSGNVETRPVQVADAIANEAGEEIEKTATTRKPPNA